MARAGKARATALAMGTFKVWAVHLSWPGAEPVSFPAIRSLTRNPEWRMGSRRTCLSFAVDRSYADRKREKR